MTIAATIAVTASVAETVQQQQAADYQNEYEKLLYGQRKEAAIETFADLRDREFQERERAAQDIQSVTRQARQAQSAAKLSALESGTGGQSVAALTALFERDQLTAVQTVRTNLDFTSRQLQNQARAAGRIQQPNKVLGPLDTPLGIVSSGLNAASSGFNASQSFPRA